VGWERRLIILLTGEGKKGVPRADELVGYYWELKGER